MRRRSNGNKDGEWRRWAALVATVWVQALTGTNLDFSAYSSALKSSMAVSQQSLSYLATASDLGKAFGWSSGLALLHLPLPLVLLLSAAMGLASYALQYCLLLPSSSSPLAPDAVPYPAVRLLPLLLPRLRSHFLHHLTNLYVASGNYNLALASLYVLCIVWLINLSRTCIAFDLLIRLSKYIGAYTPYFFPVYMFVCRRRYT